MNEKVKHFSDLLVWKKAHEYALLIYRKSQSFPKEEIYGLRSQIRRAVVSVSSNIVEGYYRLSKKEKKQFLYMSISSLHESQNQLFLAKDLKYINDTNFNLTFNKSIEVAKLINSWIKKLSHSS